MRITKIKKTFAVLVYGHVYIIWAYSEAKIKSPIFYDLRLIESSLFIEIKVYPLLKL